MHPVHNFQLYFPEIHYNMISPSTPRSSKWSLPIRVPTYTLYMYTFLIMSRDNSVGIATGYWLGDQMIGVRFPAGAGNFSLRHHVQTGSGARPEFYPMGKGGSFPGGKAAGAWCWTLCSI
jgi:hypothetical protein